MLDGSINYTGGSWEIDEKLITKCAIGGNVGGQVEEGIPYVAGNTLWAVYQVNQSIQSTFKYNNI